MKPGASRQAIATLPQLSTSRIASASTSADVRGAPTTSTRRMSGAGLKKCMPSTRSGWCVADAIAATERALVFVARPQAGEALWSSVRKMVRLRSRSSNAASITQSASDATSSSEVSRRNPASRASIHSPELAASVCLVARRARPSRIRCRPSWVAASSTSYSATSWPFSRASWAMPDPIVPAPTTPIRARDDAFGRSVVTVRARRGTF